MGPYWPIQNRLKSTEGLQNYFIYKSKWLKSGHSLCSCKPWTVYCSATMWCEEPTGNRLSPLHRRQCTEDLMEFIIHEKVEKHPHCLESTTRHKWHMNGTCDIIELLASLCIGTTSLQGFKLYGTRQDDSSLRDLHYMLSNMTNQVSST